MTEKKKSEKKEKPAELKDTDLDKVAGGRMKADPPGRGR